ncbi:MAG: hypothetical protein LVQ63_07000 [Thermoplasmatales archaeon]|nr:hypothetical protein [Thermoplasmatales archaeon]
MMQLSLLEIKPVITPEEIESKEKGLQRLKKAYSIQKGIAKTANGREAFNAAVLANHLKTEIEKMEKEWIR